ncbi:NAD-dependent epimerase/dehydratase family protein [Gimesia aquarii]|uniref:dTDP-glucose 4,6-dehydratase n=1 Tax=Gimesia aquarii TaxID=2527964 RepID=A0A517W3W5_9PLAN|nr:NAD(P)-dependent oxidoreductase [Gimesia aquarii]QDT99933.1 dTDP-glucose 4,6-dehydratase [Gimesia aquarii]
MSKRILITGGAGYLGSIAVPHLLAKGHQITVIDNFLFKQNSLAHVCIDPNFNVINGDARNPDVVLPELKKADIVIPLAALVGAPICKKDPVGASTLNKDAIYMIFDHLSKAQWIIMPTTNSAYGTGDENNFCTEESPLNPISLYAVEKVEVEKRLLEHENSISFRLATVFGMAPRMRIDLLVNDFVYRAVHDRAVVLFESAFKRNYIHVRDVARAFEHGINHFDEMKGEIFNVGLSDANLSKKELCEAIAKHISDFVFIDAPIGEDPDQRNYIVSNEKIESQGYHPAFSLDMGIQELIKGYQMIKNNLYSNI